jgi:nicotinamidase-related amidase
MEQILKARQERIDNLHRIRRDRAALLVIDMQRGFLEPGAALEVPPGRELMPYIKRLIDCCGQIKISVIFTEFVYSSAVPCLRGDPFGPEHLPAEAGKPTGFGHPSSNCLLGAEGVNSADTIPEMAPTGDELVVRAHPYDKFYGTNLDYALRSKDIRYLIITGIMADVCVNCALLTETAIEHVTQF